MTVEEVLKELEELGDEKTKKTLLKHGAKEPFFGVKVADLKKVLKATKRDHKLALKLYKTGNSDAMYLAGLMADAKQMSEEQLEQWVEEAYWYYLSEFSVPQLAAESRYGFKLGQKWIESDRERIASAGWATLSYFASVNGESDLDPNLYSTLLDRVEREIHNAPNRVRYTMNGFVIAVGTYIEELTEKSKQVANKIGKITVEMGETFCKVPLAKEYIEKAVTRGKVGKKRKTLRC